MPAEIGFLCNLGSAMFKHTTLLLIVTVFLLVAGTPSVAGVQPETGGSMLDYRSVWECDSAKFNWYCDEEERRAANKPKTPAPALKPPAKPKSIQEMTSTKEINAELERLKDVAIMSPTDANVKAFGLAVEYMLTRATVFTDVYRRVAWQTPELNHVDRRPGNQVGVDTYNDQRNARKTQSIAELARNNGIFFFFRSNCPYCHKLAPLLKRFQELHGMEIFPVSMDGGGLPDFPLFETDRGAAAKFGVDRVPALFLSNKTTGKVQAISFGMITLSEIEERIYVLTQTKPGEEF